jgi:hypothetical protein
MVDGTIQREMVVIMLPGESPNKDGGGLTCAYLLNVEQCQEDQATALADVPTLHRPW